MRAERFCSISGCWTSIFLGSWWAALLCGFAWRYPIKRHGMEFFAVLKCSIGPLLGQPQADHPRCSCCTISEGYFDLDLNPVPLVLRRQCLAARWDGSIGLAVSLLKPAACSRGNLGHPCRPAAYPVIAPLSYGTKWILPMTVSYTTHRMLDLQAWHRFSLLTAIACPKTEPT